MENSHRHILDPHSNLVDSAECGSVGQSLDLEVDRHKEAYPLSNILFYVQIPFRHDQIMSRLFQFVVTDLGVHFTVSDYAELIMSAS